MYTIYLLIKYCYTICLFYYFNLFYYLLLLHRIILVVNDFQRHTLKIIINNGSYKCFVNAIVILFATSHHFEVSEKGKDLEVKGRVTAYGGDDVL